MRGRAGPWRAEYDSHRRGMQMARALPEIEDEIRALNDGQRRELLRTLIAELDGPAEPGVEEAWLDEGERRDREIESGAVQTVSAEEVSRDAAQLLRR